MDCTLVSTRTTEGLRLDGLWRAAPDARGTLLWLHGAAGNCYSGMGPSLAPACTSAGWSCLLANTRGRDAVFSAATDQGMRRLGSAYEIVDDCRHDISAWLREATALGEGRPIVLAGHSLGAIKAVYAAAHDAPPLAGVIAVSPPRLSRGAFEYGPQSGAFLAMLATARRHLGENQPGQLMESTFPIPMLISAATFVDKYGEERYNILPLVPELTAPTLFVYGARELADGGVAFGGLDRAVAQQAGPEQSVRVTVVDGADHFYRQHIQPLGDVLLPWLAETVP